VQVTDVAEDAPASTLQGTLPAPIVTTGGAEMPEEESRAPETTSV